MTVTFKRYRKWRESTKIRYTGTLVFATVLCFYAIMGVLLGALMAKHVVPVDAGVFAGMALGVLCCWSLVSLWDTIALNYHYYCALEERDA